ncbi:uncharacterized protein LOC131940934 [Physella acuta]|uniref:uncharacterized protein LOC131940934 n=1 Tax=Physella acuta TaxID=109671 RepID=UPI0027DC03B0|nr:uncharacterized protein LOC131940934 [Physella acuta]
MDGQNYLESLRDGSRSIRINTNRRQDLLIQHEIENVNRKSIINISVKKELIKAEEPSEEEIFKRKLGPEFIPQPPKYERKTQSVFHENIKTKDVKPDQFLIMPNIPPYSPVDEGVKTILDSRSRKFPYANKKLTTTEEMKKPRISTLGVLPVRASSEFPNLRVVLEGGPAPVEDPEKHMPPRLYNTPANSFIIPNLVLGDYESDVEKMKQNELDEQIKEENEKQMALKKKPAILPGVGTSTTVKFCERAKPAPKKSHLYGTRNKSHFLKTPLRTNTAESFQSSLLSCEVNIPDESVYSRYDDAIINIDGEAEPETAVQMEDRNLNSRPPSDGSVKSLKELLEEAQQLSSTSSETTIVEVQVQKEKKKGIGLKSTKKNINRSKKIEKDLAAKDSKKVIPKVEEIVEVKRGERTVDEIIASLKDQTAYNQETEADRKIKEIMSRVMSRTNATQVANGTKTEEENTTQPDGSTQSRGESMMGPYHTTETEMNLNTQCSSADFLLTNEPGPNEYHDADPIADGFRGSSAMHYLNVDESDEQSVTTRALGSAGSFTDYPEDDDTHRVISANQKNQEKGTEPNMEQAWKDLLAPPEATAEDILSIIGEVKGIQDRKPPAPDIGPKVNILTPSVSFLSTWAPAVENKYGPGPVPSKVYSNNLHHFCRMSVEYQLPLELVHAGRKYHTPDRFPSVKPNQPFRFKPEDFAAPVEQDPIATPRESRLELAAERVVQASTDPAITFMEWQKKAEDVLGDVALSVSGQKVQIKSDESQVYWNPAPPKLGTIPQRVREVLFPQYELEELDEFGHTKPPPPKEEESESSEEEEEIPVISEEEIAAKERTVRKRHNSAEMITVQEKAALFESNEGTNIKAGDSKHQDTVSTANTKSIQERHTKLRPQTAPRLFASTDDTLIVPQDFNTAMNEITLQKQLLERAKKKHNVKEEPEKKEVIEQEIAQDLVSEVSDVLEVVPSPIKEEELTPAEKAILAGRNYVILPKQKKKKRGHGNMDSAKLDALEKMFATKPPRKLTRTESVPKLNRVIDREFRVSWQVRHHRPSVPNLLDFDEYKSRKRMQAGEDEREWVRGIWNTWFDQVFPPTPTGSDLEEEEEETDLYSHAENLNEEKKKSKKDVISDVLVQDIEEIDPITNTPENAEIFQILVDEIDKLSKVIDSMQNPTAFDLCRRGALYRKIGKLKKAQIDLDRAIKLEPDLLDAYWHRHLLYILQDRKTEAVDDLNFIMKKNKNHSGAYRSMAEIHRKQEDITMAIINYSSAIKYNPTDHEAYYQRAQLYEQRGEMLLAMEDYTKAMTIMPSRTDAIMKHGMYYFENENWNHAIHDFTALLRVDPLNSTARLFRGRAYAKMNNWVPAVEDLSAAIHLDPFNWQAFYQRGCILRRAHPERALQDFSVSLLLNDSEENIMAFLHRGILYNTLGRPDDAIPDFESVLKLNKDLAAAHVNLGLIFMTRHFNFQRAIKKFTAAIKVDPTYVRAYVCRATAYHKIHEAKNALKDFTRAIHLYPDVQQYYTYRGQLVLELGNLELAAFCVRHSSELGADNPNSTAGVSPTQQAIVQSFLKNYDKAVDALQQAARVKPSMSTFMLLGKTYMKAKQFKEAADSFKLALEKMMPWKKGDVWPAETAEAHYLSGLCLMELRNYSEAHLQFNYAIKFNPSYADAYYQRGLASVKLRQAKGIQDFNKALALNPKIFQAFLSRACYYGQKGKYAKAILNCNEAIKLQPKSVRAYLYRGALKYYIKAYDLAILDLTKATTIDTQCPLPYFNRAVCYHENGQHERALTDYSIVLLLGDMLELKVLTNRGLLYFEKKDYLNALYDFEAAAKLNPSDHRIHHTLGLCLHKLRRLKEAVSTFTKCLQLKPFFLDGLIARGNVFMDYGHDVGLEMARRDYQRVLRLDPLCLPARINLAYTAQVSGKLMQAWKHFTAVIDLRPGYKPALEGRAIVNLQMSNTFGAFQDINTSVNYGPTAELLTNRGVVQQFMGDSVLAMQDYQRAIKLDPTFSLAYFNAGNVYFHTRHFKQALDYYTKAIKYNPNDESAFLNCAITKVLLHDTKGALEDFEAAAKLSPYSAHIYFNRANLYASMQQYEMAEIDYTRALELKPDDALMLKRRADIRGKLGRRAEAIEDYKRAVDIQTRPNKIITG